MARPIKKHPGGRPTVMTHKTVQQLEEAFAMVLPMGEGKHAGTYDRAV